MSKGRGMFTILAAIFIVISSFTLNFASAEENLTVQSNGESDQISEMQSKIDELIALVEDVRAESAGMRDKLTEFEKRINSLEASQIIGDGSNEGEKIHSRISRLHGEHAEQLQNIRDHHSQLNGSVFGLHNNLFQLSNMHNITQRLKLTADLVLQERWYEALLHWSFAENHILHDVGSDANDVLSEYLTTVINFAYSGHGPAGDRLTRLLPIFKFIHKLSTKEYKVYAYETLVKEILSNSTKSVFDGSEIFILAHHIRKSLGMNAKANRIIPRIAQYIGSGGSLHIVHIGDDHNSSMDLRHRNKNSTEFPTTTLDLITKSDMIKKKNDVLQSLQYPVYAMREYKPYFAGSWTPIFKPSSSFFLLQNGANLGYLNVPNTMTSEETSEKPLLNVVLEADAERFDIEFNFFYFDEKSFGIQSAKLGKPVVITDCPHPDQGQRSTFCFTVTEPSDDGWTGSRFSAVDVNKSA